MFDKILLASKILKVKFPNELGGGGQEGRTVAGQRDRGAVQQLIYSHLMRKFHFQHSLWVFQVENPYFSFINCDCHIGGPRINSKIQLVKLL